MSRSFKKAICGCACAESEKKDKRITNRRFRRINKTRLRIGEYLFNLTREISDIWDFSKDGKQYIEFRSGNEELKARVRRK